MVTILCGEETTVVEVRTDPKHYDQHRKEQTETNETTEEKEGRTNCFTGGSTSEKKEKKLKTGNS